MRRTSLVAAFVGSLFLAVSASAEEWSFEEATIGQLPAGWISARTGTGPGSLWQVVEDLKAPAGSKVLAQVSSEGPKPLFNLCVAKGTRYTNLDLSVDLKAVAGKIDQGGGPVWRYQDENNYYVARLNPLEWNFRLYKVAQGKRTQLATADVDLPNDSQAESLAGSWHTIRIVHQGAKIRCYLDGKLCLEATDTTFPGEGRIGLWTKADAVTSFDKLSVTSPTE